MGLNTQKKNFSPIELKLTKPESALSLVVVDSSSGDFPDKFAGGTNSVFKRDIHDGVGFQLPGEPVDELHGVLEVPVERAEEQLTLHVVFGWAPVR